MDVDMEAEVAAAPPEARVKQDLRHGQHSQSLTSNHTWLALKCECLFVMQGQLEGRWGC